MTNLTVEDFQQAQLEEWGYTSIQEFQQAHLSMISSLKMELDGQEAVADGVIGRATEMAIVRPRCSCPDMVNGEMASRDVVRAFPLDCRKAIKVWYDFSRNPLKGVTKAEVHKALLSALRSWEAVIGVKFQLVESKRQAHIWATSSPISGNTLAWSMLSNSSCGDKLEQRINSKVKWDFQYLWAVWCHEIGHALGFGHLTTDRNALMYPYANRNIHTPQSSDVGLAVRHGYEVAHKWNGPTTHEKGRITLGGQQYVITAGGTKQGEVANVELDGTLYRFAPNLKKPPESSFTGW